MVPRLVGGRHIALCQSDGEFTSLTASADGYVWGDLELIRAPAAGREMLQVGNCGPPIETSDGWLVLTHGVGPMRSYAIGAILLDLDEPTRVLRKLDRPLLEAWRDDRDGYVPNSSILRDCPQWTVVFALRHRRPRIGVAWAPIDELLAEMTDQSSSTRRYTRR